MEGWDEAREVGPVMWHGMEIKGKKEGEATGERIRNQREADSRVRTRNRA